jgi:hypothetical protein
VATAISDANFKTALGECYDAVAAANVEDARKWYRLAVIQHKGLAATGSAAGVGVARQASLDEIKAAIDDMAKSQAGGGLFEVHSRWVT